MGFLRMIRVRRLMLVHLVGTCPRNQRSGVSRCFAHVSPRSATRVFPVFLCFQIWALCDPATGYLSKFEVYQGKRQKDAERNVGENVVMRLSAHLPAGTCIAADRFFGTLNLVKRLIDCGKWFVGTVMGNSEGLPAELNRGKSLTGGYRVHTSPKTQHRR